MHPCRTPLSLLGRGRLVLGAALAVATLGAAALPAVEAAPSPAPTRTAEPVALAASTSPVFLARHYGTVTGDGQTTYVANGTWFRPGPTTVSLPPRVRMTTWIVVDLDTGRILGKHGHRVWRPQASTMKLLTAIATVRTVPVDTVRRVSHFEAFQPCACAGLAAGGRYARNTLLAGMLLPSGNDAAEALAGSYPGTRAGFYAVMNRVARRLGATDTVAKNASGLPAAGSHSSARDLAILLRAALRNPAIRSTLAMPSATISTVAGYRKHVVKRVADYVNEYPGSLGKSGWTTAAGNTLVVYTPIDGHHLVTATMGAPYGYSTSGTRALTVWAAENFAGLRAAGWLPSS